MRTMQTKRSGSLLAQSLQSRMLFIMTMLLLETPCDMKELKCGQAASVLKAAFGDDFGRKGSVWKDSLPKEEI